MKTAYEPREYTVGGHWGNAISWVNPERFNTPYDYDTEFRVVGWKTPKPKVGDALKGEFTGSWVWFEFTEVNPCYDPPDMFFAIVKPIRQELK